MDLSMHIMVLQAAFGDGRRISRNALAVVIRANCTTDLYQWRPEWHFDSAVDRSAICELWQRGLRAQIEQAVTCCAPTPSGGAQLHDREGALWAFGRATHVLQDFYAHTNWVELMVAQNTPSVIAPLHGETCDLQLLPAELTSGYFNLRYATPLHGWSGCPTQSGVRRPPPPFRYCHAGLAKDSGTRGHGRDQALPDGQSYFDLAAELALRATIALWEAFCAEIRAVYGRLPSATPEQLLQRVAFGL